MKRNKINIHLSNTWNDANEIHDKKESTYAIHGTQFKTIVRCNLS